jgi:hypothetical protein
MPPTDYILADGEKHEETPPVEPTLNDRLAREYKPDWRLVIAASLCLLAGLAALAWLA